MARARAKVQLMGAWEIRQRTGFSPEWVKQKLRDRDFPAPYQTLRMGSVWDAADVEAWIAKHYPKLVDGPKRPEDDEE